MDLEPRHQQMVQAILRQHAPGATVWAFGSRVEGGAKPFSDLDLVLVPPKPEAKVLEALRQAFEDSDLPWRVDLALWDELPEGLKQRVEAQHIILFAP